MRKVSVAAAGLVLAMAVFGTTWGVERERYVAANQALYDELPTYPGSRVLSVSSGPYRENESRWSRVLGYGTLYFVTLPEGAGPEEVAAFYKRELQSEWALVDEVTEPPYAAAPILAFRRGEAGVGINLESWRGHLLEVYVDHASGG